MASVSNSGLAGAVKLVVKTFLEAEHYQDLHRFLCEHWSDMHSLTAAMRLMEAHGVHISEQAQKKYKDLPEDRVIDTLVMLMPQQSREQFEHFFLQLSLIASTTTRLRAALESGNEHQVEEVLDSAENVGVLQFILRMAVAQAGQEVKQHTDDHNNWLAACADRMNPLLQSQANALISQQALAEAKAQLGHHRVEANEKSKKVLMGLAGGNETALKTFVFATWADEVQNTKKENEIRKEYQEEIDIAEKRLQDYILSQTSIMKNMINKKHGNSIQELLHTCFDAFVAEIQVKKDKEAQDLEMAELNAKMATFSKEQAAKSKKVLSRMNAGSDAGLLEMCLQAWVQFIAEYNKNREFEDAVKKEEAKLAEFMKKQNAGASAVLNRMSQATDTGLVQQCFQGWVDVFTEQKKANELQDILNSGSGRFSEFSSRNKAGAKGAMDRAAELTEQGALIVIFKLWLKEVKVERMRRWAKDKNVKKKNQLLGVKGLFRNFANELEAGLKEGTPRVDPKKKHGYPSPKSQTESDQRA
mmetsp:Transcript_37372/g.59887  ORF Transcript_37372/g.59887 Transcript_37372/m.59887 type:complete len:529 (+) Transcript_37372:104-1690(+)